MAKFYGQIGFGITAETSPGVWNEVIKERAYFGDVLQFIRRWENGEHLNDNLNISNKISVLADPFAIVNFSTIRYVKWMGAKWKVPSVEIQDRRLVLTIGGVYNNEEPVGTP